MEVAGAENFDDPGGCARLVDRSRRGRADWGMYPKGLCQTRVLAYLRVYSRWPLRLRSSGRWLVPSRAASLIDPSTVAHGQLVKVTIGSGYRLFRPQPTSPSRRERPQEQTRIRHFRNRS